MISTNWKYTKDREKAYMIDKFGIFWCYDTRMKDEDCLSEVIDFQISADILKKEELNDYRFKTTTHSAYYC